jgi:uncharacterized protein YukE
MTYEQVEKTMRFILDQQAVTAQRQNIFDENINRISGAVAASIEHGKLINTRLDRISETVAASVEREYRNQEMLEKIARDLMTLAADSEWHRDSIAEYESVMNQFAEQTNRLTDMLDQLVRQMTSLGVEVKELTETVKNLLKGGSTGWPRN